MGKKQTTQQIKAEITRKTEQRFRDKLQALQELMDENKRLRNEKFELAKNVERIELLKDENEKLKDWVNRLQEYMDLPPDQFKREIERMKKEEEYTRLLGTFARMTGLYTTMGLI